MVELPLRMLVMKYRKPRHSVLHCGRINSSQAQQTVQCHRLACVTYLRSAAHHWGCMQQAAETGALKKHSWILSASAMDGSHYVHQQGQIEGLMQWICQDYDLQTLLCVCNPCSLATLTCWQWHESHDTVWGLLSKFVNSCHLVIPNHNTATKTLLLLLDNAFFLYR